MNKLFVFIFFILPYCLIGQYNDAALWLELDFEKKITYQHSVLLSQNVRINNNVSRIYNHFTQFSYYYKFNNFKIQPSYRFTEKFKYDKTISYKHRLMLDLIYEKELKNLTLEFRERIQNTSEDLYDDTKKNSSFYLRHKFSVTYDFNLFDLGVSGELFMEDAKYINALRNFIFINKSWNKFLSSSIFYGADFDRSGKMPENLFILGLSSKYRF